MNVLIEENLFNSPNWQHDKIHINFKTKRFSG